MHSDDEELVRRHGTFLVSKSKIQRCIKGRETRRNRGDDDDEDDVAVEAAVVAVASAGVSHRCRRRRHRCTVTALLPLTYALQTKALLMHTRHFLSGSLFISVYSER